MKQFCFFEHIGKCSRTLTHRAEYWRGNARRLYGPYAYFCSSHASAATRLGAEALEPRHTTRPRWDESIVEDEVRARGPFPLEGTHE